MRLEFSEFGDLVSVQACLPGCEDSEAISQQFSSYRGFVSINRDSDNLFTFERHDGDHSFQIEFRNLVSGESRRWRIPHRGFLLGLEISRPQGVSMASGEDFRPRAVNGFSAWLESLRYVQIKEGTAHLFDINESVSMPRTSNDWMGFKNRFWVAMIRPEQATRVTTRDGSELNELQLDLHSTAAAPHRFTIYAGPVEQHALEDANAELGAVVYSGLWQWSGWLSGAFQSALKTIDSMIHNLGLGIIVLALLLQVVLWPVSMKAIELWAGVRETRARLAPQFRSVDSRYRGQQRAEHITAIYRQENVHPLYQLKGFAGLLVLIPVLVCAFQALAENIWLYEMKFLWIADLSLPDAAIELHFGLPLFGNHVNLLPFIVFAISLSASWMLHRSRARTLSNPIRWRKVYGLPILFLILFYTVPAGMVLFLAVTIAIITLQLLIRSKRAPG
ncbi:MAG: hypothetical protein HKN15_13705 [Xanthomonadales bacterium]|nr:hypothetical protein [Xanthomonadales bacterium]